MSISSVGSTGGPPLTTSALVRRPVAPDSSRQSAQNTPSESSTRYATQAGSGAQDNQSQSTGNLAPYRPSVGNTDSTEKDSLRHTSREDGDVRELSEEDRAEVEKLQKRDVEVRAHEAAHVAAAGRYANSGANFSFQTGPDGRRYAVGGDVSISLSEEKTPEATVAKMEVVIRAAMAPAEPSAQDHRVVAEASQKKASAQREALEDRTKAPVAESGPLAAPVEASSYDISSVVSSEDGESRRSGLEAIATHAKNAGARQAYGGASSGVPTTRTMDWTA